MKAAVLLLLFSFSLTVLAQNHTQKNIITSNDQVRTIVSTFPDTPFDLKYFQFNPFVTHDNTIIFDKMTDKEHLIYSTVYHTGKFGFRKTKTAEQAEQHLLLGGDSNMFGVGVGDEETLPSRLAQKLSTKKVINLGLGGVGPSSLLFFLQNYSLESIVGKSKKGMMIYDFHHHLIDRVIGSKLFLSWSKSAPRYAIEDGKLVYAGVFEDYLPAKFYMLLNKLPWNNVLFPNLPRINHDHILLTAKVIAEIKKQYLQQTDPHNQFIVTFNPAYNNSEYSNENLKDLQDALTKEHVETAVFNVNETRPLPIISREYHQNEIAHENYSQMLIKKLDLTNK